jgi:hypothetical protein
LNKDKPLTKETLQGLAKVKFEFKHFLVDGAKGLVKDYTEFSSRDGPL